MIGTSLGPYKIIEQLGAGGMGEVYLGEDTRLGRKVAIKVLPEEYASDPERLARFEQEARAAAALNHPHIAVVHDVGSETGDDGTITHFMVQEYLEGDTLREPLKKGALPLSRALDLATEIAEALAAAHDAGIVHLDLKPENVFITKEGHAKVLDFGLAKLMEMAPAMSPGTDASKSPTLLGTVAGQVMGTAGYMAPEQVQGDGDIDHRADVFAFGTVLYEMVSGRQAFAGRNVLDTLHQIANVEPEPIGEARHDLPQKLQWILEKSLAKEPAKRYQTAADLVVDLQALGADVESGTALPMGGQPVVAPVAVETARGIPWKLAAPIAVAIALLGALAVWITIPSLPEFLVTRFYIDYPPETVFLNTSTLGVAISPDGKSVVFNADRQLWLRAIDDLVATPIRGTESARVPFFSPDGQQLGFWGGDGQIKSVSITGGAPVSLGPAPERAFGASWADDGYIYFGQGAEGILRVSENGGEPEVVVAMEEGEQAHGPQLLPGGEWLLFTLRSGSGSWNDASIAAQPVSGGERKPLVAGGTDGRYVPTGHIVYSLQGNLFAVPFDADSIEVLGGSVSIVEEVRQATGITGAGQYAFSDRGGLVYIPGSSLGAERQLVWVERDGATTPFSERLRAFGRLSLSPDGRRVAVEIRGDDGPDIWILDERNDVLSQLTFDGADVPVWSSDGEWVAYRSNRDGATAIYRSFPDLGGREPELLVSGDGGDIAPVGTSLDGSLLLYAQLSPSTGLDTKALPLLDEDPTPLEAPSTPGTDVAGGFSPDGNWWAYATDETGRYEVWVAEFPGPGVRRQVSNNGGSTPVGSLDGSELFYSGDGRQQLMVVDIATEPELNIRAPRLLFALGDRINFLAGNASRYGVTADGQRFVMVEPMQGAIRGDQINVVLNWFEELKQRVPTGQ